MTARLIDFDAEDTIPSKTWITNMINASHIREATEAGWGGLVGGAHRFGVAVVLEAGAGTEEYIIDATIDWRDRMVFVAYSSDVELSPAMSEYPGVDTDILADGTVNTVGYTGLGGATYDLRVTSLMELRVDSTTGHLSLVESAGASRRITALVLIIASEQTDERSSPAANPAIPYGADGDAIEPIELNAMQDGAMLSQMRDADGTDPDTDTLVDDSLFPLGPALEGQPGVPRKFTALSRVGTAFSNYGLMHRAAGREPWRAREVRRQRVAGSIRVFKGEEITGTTTVTVDSANDWRDRFIFALGRSHIHATEDIRPGGAEDDQHNTTDDYSINGYTGPGDDGTGSYRFILDGGLLLYVDEDDGSLKVKNEGAVRYTITIMIYATFPLGPRTPQSE